MATCDVIDPVLFSSIPSHVTLLQVYESSVCRFSTCTLELNQGCQMVQMREIHSSVCFDCSHWLVVREDACMVTGRQEPRLVLVSLACEGGHVCLNGPNMKEL